MNSFVINIKDEILKDKVLWLLEHFKNDGLEIVSKEDLEDLKLLKATREDETIDFEEYLKNEKELELVYCIEVVVSEEVAKDRVLGRNRGDDDKVEVFNNRMSVYIEPLKAIQDFYESKNILKKIDGERTIEEIVDEMDSFILSKIV